MPVKNKVIHAKSGKIAQILKRLEIIATKDLLDSPVLFTGPTGSGKEMLANHLADLVEKEKSEAIPYKKINCGGFPENLIESELFGHEKGAFTGASKERKGIIEESNGGVLFLDEIGAIPKPLQAKFLRVLEDRKVRKVGSSNTENVEVRFFAATNSEDLLPDLKHRFLYKIDIPLLCSIPEEIPFLLKHYLKDSPFRFITIGTLLSMANMEWEGNARELRNVVIEAKISAESNNQEVGDKSSELVSKEGFFDIVLLSDSYSGLAKQLMERYWVIRTFTDFDEKLSREIPAVKRKKMDDSYRVCEALSKWKIDSQKQSLSLRKNAQYVLKDELYLEMNKDFPATAAELIKDYAVVLDVCTFDLLDTLISGTEKHIYIQKGLAPSIQPNQRFFKLLEHSENKTEVSGFFEQPWKQAQKSFKRAYWNHVNSMNPGVNQKQIAKIMGISEQQYGNIKKQFN
jgi:DNA-binding NtrC family response regulator